MIRYRIHAYKLLILTQLAYKENNVKLVNAFSTFTFRTYLDGKENSTSDGLKVFQLCLAYVLNWITLISFDSLSSEKDVP